MLTAEIGSVNLADGFPAEEIAKAVGAGVSAAIKTAVETAQDAPTAKPSGDDVAKTPQEPASSSQEGAEAPAV